MELITRKKTPSGLLGTNEKSMLNGKSWRICNGRLWLWGCNCSENKLTANHRWVASVPVSRRQRLSKSGLLFSTALRLSHSPWRVAVKSQGLYDIFSFGDFSKSSYQEPPFLIVVQEVTQFSPSFCWSFLGAEPPRGRLGTFVRVASADGASVTGGYTIEVFPGDKCGLCICWDFPLGGRMDITDLNDD